VLSQLIVQILDTCLFEPPFGWGLGTTYDVHLWLIGKRLVDFLLVLTELFSLGVTAEALQGNIGWKSAILLHRGPVESKFHVEGVAPTNYSSSQKMIFRVLLKSGNIHFVTIHAFERRTDIFLIARPRLHSMQRGNKVWNKCWSFVHKISVLRINAQFPPFPIPSSNLIGFCTWHLERNIFVRIIYLFIT